jgi:TP901 family phage tail tape measure protein
MFKTMTASVIIGAALGNSYFRTLDTAAQASKRLGAQWKETDSKLKAVSGVVKYREQLELLRAKQAQMGTSSERLNRGIAEVEKLYRKAKTEAKAYGIAVKDAANEQKRLGAELAKIEQQQNRLAAKEQAGEKLKTLRGRFIGASAALYGFGRMAGSAMDREEAALYLRTAINAQDKDAALGRSLQHARSFARRTLATDTEILQIEYQLNSAGLAEDVARAGTEAVHKVAKVTRGDAEQVAEIIGITFNNLGNALSGPAADKMAQIGNILTKVQLKYQIRDFGQLGESMRYGAAAAAAYKVELDQTATILGQLNTAGLQGSRAGTAYKAMLGHMGKAAEELNFEVVRGTNGQLDMIATLEALNEQLSDLDTDERANRLIELFGYEGAEGVIPLLEKITLLKEGLKEVSAAGKSGLVDEEYERFLRSAAGQTMELKQNVSQLGEAFATTLLPAINVVAGGLAKLFGGIGWLIEKVPALGWLIGAMAVGFATSGIAIGALTAATWLWNAALAANPIVWIIGAVAALAVGIALLWKNWDRVWGWIKQSALAVGKVLKNIFDATPIGMLVKGIGWVGDRIAGMRSREAVAGAAAAATIAATPLPAAAMPQMAQQASMQSSITVSAPITVNPAAGQSEEDIGLAVAQHIEQSQRTAEAQQRARLYE